jgi:catechol 2,3-dioxygenase-like lactoylglutathione lyase family enzyme
MTLLAIDHVQLAMPAGREPEARAFYTELLGLPERPKPPELAARGGAWFESTTVKVHLGVEKEFRPARKAHPGFLVQDLEALAARLRAAGFTLIADDALPGQARYFVDDPFGNRIELLQAPG